MCRFSTPEKGEGEKIRKRQREMKHISQIGVAVGAVQVVTALLPRVLRRTEYSWRDFLVMFTKVSEDILKQRFGTVS